MGHFYIVHVVYRFYACSTTAADEAFSNPVYEDIAGMHNTMPFDNPIYGSINRQSSDDSEDEGVYEEMK